MLDFSNSKILIVGDVMLDKYYFGKVDRISPEAPVPIVNIQKEEFFYSNSSNENRAQMVVDTQKTSVYENTTSDGMILVAA